MCWITVIWPTITSMCVNDMHVYACHLESHFASTHTRRKIEEILIEVWRMIAWRINMWLATPPTETRTYAKKMINNKIKYGNGKTMRSAYVCVCSLHTATRKINTAITAMDGQAEVSVEMIEKWKIEKWFSRNEHITILRVNRENVPHAVPLLPNRNT